MGPSQMLAATLRYEGLLELGGQTEVGERIK